MSDYGERIERLSRKQRTLLYARYGGRLTPFAKPILPRDPAVEPPLSFAQRRLWFLQQLEPQNPFYNEPLLAVRVTGRIDIAQVQRAVDRIVARHETLRSSFPSTAGVPRVTISPSIHLPVKMVNLSRCEAQEQEREFTRIIRHEARHVFDLSQAPLARVTLVRMDSTSHVLLVAMHHIISDGWSLRILIRELASASADVRNSLPIQYGDYAVWQCDFMIGPELSRLLSYWKKQLHGAPFELALTTDKLRPRTPSYRGGQVEFFADPQLLEALRRIAQRGNYTLYMVLLSAFFVLLHRYTGQTDIVVGTPVAGRAQPELESVIGFFVNTLVLRADLSGNPRFQALMDRIREVVLDAVAHDQLPFDRLVEELNPKRDPSRHPLFQVMLAHNNFRPERYEVEGLLLERIDIFSGFTKFDFALITDETESGKLQVQLDYAVDLFEHTTAQTILADFRAILESVAGAPEARLSTIGAGRLRQPPPQDTRRAIGSVSPTSHRPSSFAQALRDSCRDHAISPTALVATALQVVLMRLGTENQFTLYAGIDGRFRCRGRRLSVEGRPHPYETFVDAAIRTERLLVEETEDSAVMGQETLAQSPLGLLVHEVEANPASRLRLPNRVEASLARIITCTIGTDDFQMELRDGQSKPYRAAAPLSQALLAVMHTAVRQPQMQLGYLPVVGGATRTRLLSDVNRASIAANPLRIEEQFERQAFARPDALAVECGADRWTYADLSRRSNGLARRLQQHGVGPESIVACFLDPSADTVMAVLAVLKAGGAFVLMSPAQPPDRTLVLLEQIRPQVVLTTSALRSRLPRTHTDILRLDVEDLPVESGPIGSFGNADSLAFLAITSGTTAEPKLAMICHAGVVNITAAHGIRPTARVGHVNSFGFDAAIGEIFNALLSGATLVVIDPARRWGEDLTEELQRNQIDVLIAVPSLIATLDPRWLDRPGVTVFSVGEPCPPDLARTWSRLCKFYNAYGPAETCICSHMWQVPPGWTAADRPVPIGGVVPHARSYILDEFLEPVPVGIVGELFIGGIGVGRGYLFQPATTAVQFLPDPFADSPGQRMYRSGDLACYARDGTIELHGRRDEQIKIRGTRVHPAEVERTLAQHPSVAEIAVVPSFDKTGAAMLAAYVAVAPDSRIPELEQELLDGWKMLADEAPYQQCADEEFNTVGWRSSYTAGDVPADEMHDLVQRTADRILAHRPRRVLEVGCGTGLLLFRIARFCEAYCGIDFSGPAIDNICSRLSRPPWFPNVTVAHRRADDLDDLADVTFDIAIINSVVQYFPSSGYLHRVVASVLDRVEDGGVIFVGDVRHLGMLNAFHSSVALHRSSPGDVTHRLKEDVERRSSGESELLVSPEFFLDLQSKLKRIRYVSVQPKRGLYHNEFNRFRYDVTLHVGRAPGELVELPWIEWDASKFDGPELRRHLAEVQPECLAFRHVPNARVDRDFRALAALENGEASTVTELRRLLASQPSDALDPEWFWTLADDLPYRVELSWLSNADEGRFDVILWRQNGSSAHPCKFAALPRPAVAATSGLTNRPAKEKYAAAAAAALRRFASEKLPTHLVPAEIRVVDELPRMPSGKLDRSVLRSWIAVRDSAPRTLVGRGPIEQVIADVWRQVLGRSEFDLSTDFFAVGGHSLLATQVIARVNNLCRCNLPLRTIFDAPTIEKLAQAVGTQRSAVGPCELTRKPARRSEESALSHDQSRLWFLEQLLPDSPRYHIPIVLQLTGNLDRVALAGALNLICRRHQALHSQIVETNGVPRQSIDLALRIPIQIVDVSELSGQERALAAERLQIESFRQLFDFGKGPLIRGLLLSLSDTVHILQLTVHHIVADGWSALLMIQELCELYEASIRGRPPALKELSLRYADYVDWQEEWLASEQFHATARYWIKQLGGLSSLELPTDRPRGPVQTYRGARLYSLVPRTLLGQLDALTGAEGVTRFMLLASALQALLSRLAGQMDIAIGFPIANRENPLLEHLVGFFANTLVLRCDLSGCRTFRDFLRQVREVALAAYDHQSMPFAKLVELLRPERHLSRTPIVQVWFSYFNVDFSDIQLPELQVTFPEVPCLTSEFELSLSVREAKEGLSCAWIYNTDLYDHDTIEQIANGFAALLSGVARDADCPISLLPLLSAADERSLLDSGNSSEAQAPTLPIHELIEATAAALPDACAVRAEGVSWTFREFNGRANQLARYLLHSGVTSGTPVGVLMESGLEALLTVVAVLKSGGLYVALDPAFPVERLQRIASSASLFAVITTKSAIGPVLDVSRQIVLTPQFFSQLNHYDVSNLDTHVAPHDVAYLAFTSGSTGVPKGVMVQHQAVANVLLSLADDLAVDATTVVCAGTSMSFDVSALELFLPLLRGGTVAMAARSTMLDAELLSAFLLTHKVTVLQGTPTLFGALVGSGWGGNPALMILCGGETLHRQLADELLRRCGKLVNLYGPTETTIWSTWNEIRADGNAISIGRPVNNTRCYVLDDNMSVVPMQIVGELYIGGSGVALGYMGRPGETAERFLPDPFSSTPGARMYRTGDLVRRRRDGIITHIGRIDRQVKIRGCRVELGEVEAVLQEHPGVGRAVVVSMPHESDGSHLIAYWAKNPGAEPSTAELRRFLRSRLPAYMLPAILTRLDTIPASQTGKTDVRALMLAPHRERNTVCFGPRTLVERAVARIWALVLGRDAASLTGSDDFFNDLEGHSLLTLQVVSLIRRLFRIRLPVRSLFEAPTLSDFAQCVDVAKAAAAIRIPIHARVEPLPLSPEQRRSLSFAAKRRWSTDIVTSALYLPDPIDTNVLRASLEALVARHEALRMAICLCNGVETQTVVALEAVEIVEVHRAGLPSRNLDLLWPSIIDEVLEPIDLQRSPSLRALRVRAGSPGEWLVLAAPRAFADEQSMWRLSVDFATIYCKRRAGDLEPLAALPLQYLDYSAWIAQWRKTGGYVAQLEAFAQQVAENADLCSSSPPEYPTTPSRRTCMREWRPSYRQLAAARELAQAEDVILADVLLAAFLINLRKIRGGDTFFIAVRASNRDWPDSHCLVGPVADDRFLCLRLGRRPDLPVVARQVSEANLDAFLRRDLAAADILDRLAHANGGQRVKVPVLFQVNQNIWPDAIADIEARALFIRPPDVEMALVVNMSEHAIAATIHFDAEAFDEAWGDLLVRGLDRSFASTLPARRHKRHRAVRPKDAPPHSARP
jgi:amino acid adenylation domain-containing protein